MQDNVLLSQYEHFERLYLEDTPYAYVAKRYYRYKPWDDILLASGDAIVFGGPARDIFHGVVRLDDNTAPEGCGLEKGRLNMTFRQVQL